MLCNVWAIKNQWGLLGFCSNGEEGGGDCPSTAPGRLLDGGDAAFWPVYWGRRLQLFQSKLMQKGKEGVCVHACSHKLLGWPPAATPLQLWGPKGHKLKTQHLLLFTHICIQMISEDMWWWGVLGMGCVFGREHGLGNHINHWPWQGWGLGAGVVCLCCSCSASSFWRTSLFLISAAHKPWRKAFPCLDLYSDVINY